MAEAAVKPRTSRPTTPIRRLSSSSLRQSSLSASRSRTNGEAPLQHLGPLFAELADAVSDLSGNIENLANVNKDLQEFNEAFASYLLGLRVNAYTASWDSAPTRLNFELAAIRRAKEDEEENERRAQQQQRSVGTSHGSSEDESKEANETATMQDSEYSFMARDDQASRASSARGRGGTTTRGRGRGRGGKVVLTKKERDAQNAFVDSMVQLMPIKFREQEGPARQETEKILLALKAHPDGLTMVDCNKLTMVPTHRINEAFTALVRAKAALKVVVKGATSYRLDPERLL